MKVATTEEGQKAARACLEFGEKLGEIRKSLENEAARLRVKEEEVKARYPALLAAEALGEIEGDAVSTLKRELVEVGDRRELLPLILKGIRERETANNAAHAKALNRLARLKAAEGYEKAVATLQAGGDIDFRDVEADVRLYGRDAGKSQDEIEKIIRAATVKRGERIMAGGRQQACK